MSDLRRRIRFALAGALFSLLATTSVQAMSNRIFMSTNGNNLSDCANPLTPCLTFAGALAQVNAGGEVIAEATGGYGLLNITQAVTISGPPGVVIYSSLQVTVNAPAANVVLRGLTIDETAGNGIEVQSVGSLWIEDCVIKGLAGFGIHMGVPGRLNLRNTDVKNCAIGLEIDNSSGMVTASIDHCHFDGNAAGFRAHSTAPGGSMTVAVRSTADNNFAQGWLLGASSSGVDILNLEFCSGSENQTGVAGNSLSPSSVVRFAHCVFANNVGFGVNQQNSGTFESRGDNTITGNGSGPIGGSTGTFSPI